MTLASKCFEPRPSGCEQAGHSYKETKQGMLLWLGHSEVRSSRCHSLSSIDEASLVAIQATLAMRPVKPSIQSCYVCTTCYVGFVQLSSRPSPGSYSEYFIRRGCHRCSARVLKFPSWGALNYCRSQVPFRKMSHRLY